MKTKLIVNMIVGLGKFIWSTHKEDIAVSNLGSNDVKRGVRNTYKYDFSRYDNRPYIEVA